MDATEHLMIRLQGVGKTYAGGSVAVKELDLDVSRGELVTLVGPSGCGKSTTLKMINRLIEPTTGRIELGGEDVTKMDAVQLRRRIGYVIQQIGLFPHQTIRTNVATLPGLLGWDKKKTRDRVDELLSTMGLDPEEFGTATRISCPVANVNASASLEPSRPTPTCCLWTNRSVPSTQSFADAFRTSSSRSRPTSRRPSSS